MGITVKWIWKCDLCKIEMHEEYKTSVYSDEMAMPSRGWTGNLDVPKDYRSHPTADICIACPKCKENPDWSKYNA